MRDFIYQALPARVVFGVGTQSRLGEEIARLGCRRALLLATVPQRETVEAVAHTLGPLGVGVLAEAVMHTPVEVTERALATLRSLNADCLIAVGGGSTIGLAKALALRTGLPQIAVPTTYAGSEMTPILGQTEGGRKTTIRSTDVLPEVVIYDVTLTLTLPPSLSATSGLNAIAHAVEATYAVDGNPIVSLMAEEAIRALATALPRIQVRSDDVEARSEALYGAWLCGLCLGSVGMALHHKLCHVLGGTFDLPHAETHAVVLPYAVAYNRPGAPEAMARIARALGADDPAAGLLALAARLGAPRSLRDLGMPESGIDVAADQATQAPYPNPVPIERVALRDLVARAWAGAALP